MSKTRTSIIIPVYNEKTYLLKCLKAIEQQNVPVAEVIVVDNNTTDGSVAAAKKKFPNVTFLKEEQQGIVFARNTGFDAATGDIIAKIDADTILRPTWHEDLLETMGNFDGWTGYIGNNELNPKLQPIVNPLFRFFVYRLNKPIAGIRMMFGANLAVRNDAWQKIKADLLMRNDIWEDLDMSMAMKEHGMRIALSTHIGADISARSANASIKNFYLRTLGQPRVYYLRQHWLSFALSVPFVHIGFLTWLLLKPLAFIGQKINQRPRPEQY